MTLPAAPFGLRPPAFGSVPHLEALQWFMNRLDVDAAAARSLSARARRQAFWVSHVTRLDVLTDVHEALEDAIQAGTPFAEFKATVMGRLEAEWGGQVANPAARVQTIYRTNMQHAYQAGRWQQLRQQNVINLRPYWMYDSVLDDSTTSVCRSLNGVIKRWDDRFWRTRFPPNHYNCRSGVRSLTARQAANRGGVTKRARGRPAEGFDAAPAVGEWRPDLAKYPPRLVAAFRRATGGRE